MYVLQNTQRRSDFIFSGHRAQRNVPQFLCTVWSLLFAGIVCNALIMTSEKSAPKKHVVDLNTSALLCSKIENNSTHKHTNHISHMHKTTHQCVTIHTQRTWPTDRWIRNRSSRPACMSVSVCVRAIEWETLNGVSVYKFTIMDRSEHMILFKHIYTLDVCSTLAPTSNRTISSVSSSRLCIWFFLVLFLSFSLNTLGSMYRVGQPESISLWH